MCSQSLPQFKVGKRLSVLRLNDVVIIIYRLLNKYKIQRVKRKGKKENKSKKKWKKSCKNRVCNLEKISVATLLLLRPKVANQPWPCYLCTVQRDKHRASKQHFAHHRAAPLNKSLYLQRERGHSCGKNSVYFSFFHSTLSEKCLIISHSVTPVHQLARRNRRALKNQGLFSLESKKKNLHHHEKVEEVAGSSGGPLRTTCHQWQKQRQGLVW